MAWLITENYRNRCCVTVFCDVVFLPVKVPVFMFSGILCSSRYFVPLPDALRIGKIQRTCFPTRDEII